MAATAEDIHKWVSLGGVALADLDKYLRRGSLWEALARLQEARQQVWRLWAAAHDVPCPAFGLTAMLDNPAAGVPPRMEETVARLDAHDLRRAGRACALLLEEAAGAAARGYSVSLPDRLAGFVSGRLEISDTRSG